MSEAYTAEEIWQRQDVRLKWIEENRQRDLKTFRRAFEGNRPAAVKAFCLECLDHQRDDIRSCTSPTCPLYMVRPGRAKPPRDESKPKRANNFTRRKFDVVSRLSLRKPRV